MREKEYRRLTRSKSRSIFGIVSTARSSLWLGQDHLLGIDTSGYTETYKRFYFRDIQAVILRKTEWWKAWGVAFGAGTALFALIALLGGDAIVAWIFGSLAGLFLFGLILDLAAGPSCACCLRTAVQTEELPSMNRVRRARKTLARLRPLIAQAQGELAPEEIPARMQAWLAANSPGNLTPSATPRFVVDDPNAPPRIVG
jgi:hypothetical protein